MPTSTETRVRTRRRDDAHVAESVQNQLRELASGHRLTQELIRKVCAQVDSAHKVEPDQNEERVAHETAVHTKLLGLREDLFRAFAAACHDLDGGDEIADQEAEYLFGPDYVQMIRAERAKEDEKNRSRRINGEASLNAFVERATVIQEEVRGLKLSLELNNPAAFLPNAEDELLAQVGIKEKLVVAADALNFERGSWLERSGSLTYQEANAADAAKEANAELRWNVLTALAAHKLPFRAEERIEALMRLLHHGATQEELPALRKKAAQDLELMLSIDQDALVRLPEESRKNYLDGLARKLGTDAEQVGMFAVTAPYCSAKSNREYLGEMALDQARRAERVRALRIALQSIHPLTATLKPFLAAGRNGRSERWTGWLKELETSSRELLAAANGLIGRNWETVLGQARLLNGTVSNVLASKAAYSATEARVTACAQSMLDAPEPFLARPSRPLTGAQVWNTAPLEDPSRLVSRALPAAERAA